MLKMTFKKYHVKKKKPVTSAGYLSPKLSDGFASPSGTPTSLPSASAAAAALATGESARRRRLNGPLPPANLRGSGEGDKARRDALPAKLLLRVLSRTEAAEAARVVRYRDDILEPEAPNDGERTGPAVDDMGPGQNGERKLRKREFSSKKVAIKGRAEEGDNANSDGIKKIELEAETTYIKIKAVAVH